MGIEAASKRRVVGIEDDDEDSEQQPILQSPRSSGEGAVKRRRTSEAGPSDAADQPATKRRSQTGCRAAADKQHEDQQQQQPAYEVQAPSAEADTATGSAQQSPVARACAEGMPDTPFAGAANAGNGDVAAVDAESAGHEQQQKQQTPLAAKVSRGSRQLPTRTSSRSQQQHPSRLGATGSGTRKAGKKAGKKAVDDEADNDAPDSDDHMPFLDSIWQGVDMEEWGDGVTQEPGDRPAINYRHPTVPVGDKAVGFGYWDFYKDEGKWYRLGVYHYDAAKRWYWALAEDGEVVNYPEHEWEKPKGRDDRYFCVPPHSAEQASQQQQQQQHSADQEQEQKQGNRRQEPQAAAAAAAASAFPPADTDLAAPGSASKGKGKAKPKRKSSAQPPQQGKKRKLVQPHDGEDNADDAQQQLASSHLQLQLDTEAEAPSPAADEATPLSAPAKGAAKSQAEGEATTAGQGAAAAATDLEQAESVSGASVGAATEAAQPAASKAAAGSKKQPAAQQHKSATKQTAAVPTGPGGAVANKAAKAAAAATKQQQQQAAATTTEAAAGAGAAAEAGAEAGLLQDQAAKLQECLKRLHEVQDMFRAALQQQHSALQTIESLNLSPATAKEAAAQASRASPVCDEALKVFSSSINYIIPADCQGLLREVREMGARAGALLKPEGKAVPASPTQRKQQPGKGSAPQQQQQQRQKPPGLAGRPAIALSKQQQVQAQQQQQRKDRQGSSGAAPGTAADMDEQHHKQQQQQVGARQGSGGQATPAGRVSQQANGTVPAVEGLEVFLQTCEQLVPLKPLHNRQRDQTVGLLASVLLPQQTFSPFAVAQELEGLLQGKHGSSQGRDAYLRHLQVLWEVLGGREFEEAQKAAQAAAAAAATAAEVSAGDGDVDEAATQARAEAEAKAAAAAQTAADARERFEGTAGDAGAAALRVALLEGRISARELFDLTAQKIASEQRPVK